MEATEFVREWDLLYTTYGEIREWGAYANWRMHILGQASIPDPLASATSDYSAGWFSYYAYLRLYGYLASGNPDLYISDKYGIHEDGGTPPGKYRLTTKVEPALSGCGVTLSPAGGLYDPGAVVTLTAVAATGYSFVGWSGDLSGAVSPATITMDRDKEVTAIFEQTAAPGIFEQMMPMIGMVVMVGMMGAIVPMMTGMLKKK